MPVVTKTNELSVLVSVYNTFSLFNDHSMRLFFHVYMNANELSFKKKKKKKYSRVAVTSSSHKRN